MSVVVNVLATSRLPVRTSDALSPTSLTVPKHLLVESTCMPYVKFKHDNAVEHDVTR